MIIENQKYEYDWPQQVAPAPAPAQPPGHHTTWWHSEKRIATQIEVLLFLYVLLVAIQVVCGWYRRCRSSAFIKYPLWLAYSISQPLVAYTLGVMYYSPFKRSDSLILTMLAVSSLGRANTMTAYNVDDNKRYTTHLFQHALFVVNFLSINLALQHDMSWTSSPRVIVALFALSLFLFYSTTNGGRIFASVMASSFSDKGSSYLQTYMRTEHTRSIDYDPVTLRGYDYLLFSSDKEDITVSKVWLSNQGPLGGSD